MARLLVIGSSNTDLTVRLPRLPSPGETVLGGSLREGPGGKGANQAVAAARAGAEVILVSAIGDDAFGRRAIDAYRAVGIDVHHVQIRSEIASGVALIFVGESGENMIGVAPGANALLGPEDLDSLPGSLFEQGGTFLVAGLEVPLEAIGRGVVRASRAGMRIVLNPAPAVAGLSAAPWLSAVEVLTPNRGELGLLTGLPTRTLKELGNAAGALRSLGVARVVVTLGEEGCLLVDESESARHWPAMKVKAVDTVGAGDAFTAVLAVSLAEGRSLDEAAALASAAAGLAVTRPGAQESFPSREEIEHSMRMSDTEPRNAR